MSPRVRKQCKVWEERPDGQARSLPECACSLPAAAQEVLKGRGLHYGGHGLSCLLIQLFLMDFSVSSLYCNSVFSSLLQNSNTVSSFPDSVAALVRCHSRVGAVQESVLFTICASSPDSVRSAC